MTIDFCGVLSFDPNKIRLFYSEKWGIQVVEKKFNQFELPQIIMAKAYLKKFPIVIECGINICVASVLEISNNGNLITKFYEGNNVERLLRFLSGNERQKWIFRIRELFIKFREIGFIWGDFAPRNMIFNSKTKTIHLVDFERQSEFLFCECSVDYFSEYIRKYSQEEFCCFLFPEERINFFDGLIIKENRKIISSKKIKSRRRLFLLESYIGKSSYFGGKEVSFIEEAMSSLAMPFIVNGVIIHPMFVIEEIVKIGGYNAYRDIIEFFWSEKCKNYYQWACFLQKTFRRFYFVQKT